MPNVSVAQVTHPDGSMVLFWAANRKEAAKMAEAFIAGKTSDLTTPRPRVSTIRSILIPTSVSGLVDWLNTNMTRGPV